MSSVKKSTLLLFRVIPVRTCKPRCVLLNSCCECSLRHRHVPCHLRRNYFDRWSGRDAAVRVGVENAPVQSEVHVILSSWCALLPVPSHAGLNCADYPVTTTTETGLDGASAITNLVTWVLKTLEMLTLAEICSGLCLGQEYFPCLAAGTVLWGPCSQPVIAGMV